VLSGPKVFLAPVRETDLETLFYWVNDRESVLLGSVYKPVHAAAHRDWIDAIVRREDAVIFAIRTVDDDRLVGYLQLVGIDTRARSAELRIRIGDGDARGQGLGVEAGALILRHAFDDLNLERVWAHVFSTNEPVRRGARRVGFREEGCLRRAAYVGGEYLDVIVIGVLRDEFRQADPLSAAAAPD
jgi:diamine N-acetyltransferase